MRDIDGDLFLAIQAGNIKGITEALENGASLHAQDNFGKTPLYNAVYMGDIKITWLLIKEGASVEPQINGGSLLHLAARQPAIFFISSEKRAALEQAYAEIARLLIAKLDPQYEKIPISHISGKAVYVSFADKKDEHGCTPLHYAVQSGAAEIAIMLIIEGADVNARDCKGNVPLHYATFEHSAGAVRILLQHNADLEARNNLQEPINTRDCHVSDPAITRLYLSERERRDELARTRWLAIKHAETRTRFRSSNATDAAHDTEKCGLAAIGQMARQAINLLRRNKEQEPRSQGMKWKGFKLVN